jgi:hypothetical protein
VRSAVVSGYPTKSDSTRFETRPACPPPPRYPSPSSQQDCLLVPTPSLRISTPKPPSPAPSCMYVQPCVVSVQWWRAVGAEGEEASAPLLSQSLGDAQVFCTLTGERIERDVRDVGKPRMHCLGASCTTTGLFPDRPCSELAIQCLPPLSACLNVQTSFE